MRTPLLWLCILAAGSSACGEDDNQDDAGGFQLDGGSDTGVRPDTGPLDTGVPEDSGVEIDMGVEDTGIRDMGVPDMGTPDMGTPDTGTPDTGTPDTGTPDMGTPDMGTPDMGTPDMGTPDMGTPDMGVDLCAGVDCSALDGVCQVGVCNPANGMCEAQVEADGTICDDGDACTVDTTCQMGTCTSSTTLDCSSLDGNCVVGACDSATGCVAQPAPMGTSCSDNNNCTTMDMCDSLGMCLGQVGGCGPGIYVHEDFDSNDGGFVSGGTSSSWAYGIPNGTIITAESATDYEWVTNLSGDYVNYEDSYIESPAYDLGSAAGDVVLDFQLMYETEPGYDEGWVETSTDGGTTWNKVGAQGEGRNWYTTSDDTWDGSSEGVRRTAAALVPGAGGASDVRFRFRFDSDVSNVREGFAIDDVRVRDPGVDLAIQAVTLPNDGCGSVQGSVVVEVANYDATAQTGFTLSVEGLAASTLTETVNETVPAFGTLRYTLQTGINVSAETTVTVTVNAAGDSDTSNDARSAVARPRNVVVVPGTGWTEGFETGGADWRTSGQTSWAIGQPTGTVIGMAANGANAAVTNLSGSYDNDEDGYLESPCLDLSNFGADPVLEFQHLFELQDGLDDGWVETSTNGGVTWTKLGTAGDGSNWYNDASNVWTGSSGVNNAWRLAGNVLSGAAGSSETIVRFALDTNGTTTLEGIGIDDVRVGPASGTDMGVDDVTLPVPGCGVVAGELSATLRNHASASATSFTLMVAVNGTTTVTETVNEVVVGYGTLDYTFPNPISVAGQDVVTVTVVATGDTDASNDSASETAGEPIPLIDPSTGYTESFETDAGGFEVLGASTSWERGAPAGTFIGQAATGTVAFVTNLSGNYATYELGAIVSPCYDLSSYSTDPTLSMAIIYQSEAEYDGTWVEISTDAGATWTQLGSPTSGTNWYNNTILEWWDDVSGNANQWVTASHPMTGGAGSAAVRIRIIFESDVSYTEEGVGIDDISISP